MRNAAVAARAIGKGERALVVALVRKKDQQKVDAWGASIIAPDGPLAASAATWEDIYALAQAATHPPSSLLGYMRGKSVGLRPAFDVRA